MKSRKVTFRNDCISMTPEKYKFNFNNLSIYINQVVVLKAFFAYEDTCDQTNFFKNFFKNGTDLQALFAKFCEIFRDMRRYHLNSPVPETFFRGGGDLLDDVVLNRYQKLILNIFKKCRKLHLYCSIIQYHFCLK